MDQLRIGQSRQEAPVVYTCNYDRDLTPASASAL